MAYHASFVPYVAISKNNSPGCLEALNSFHSNEIYRERWFFTENKAIHTEDAIRRWFHCEKALERIQFLSDSGPILLHVDIFLQVIAPFVENDSFISVLGEDGAMWKIIFKDTSYKSSCLFAGKFNRKDRIECFGNIL